MKIAIINSVYNFGSTGRIAKEMCDFLNRNKHEARVFYGRSPISSSSSAHYFGNKFSHYLHVLFARLFDSSGLHSRLETKKLIKALNSFKPDVVVLHNIHGYYLNIISFVNFLKKKNIKVIFVAHDCWMITGHCAYFDYCDCKKWKTQCFNCPEKKSYPKSVLFDNSKRNFLIKKRILNQLQNMTIVTPSIWLAEIMKESFLRKFEIVVINNGINLQTFKKTHSEPFVKKYSLEGKKIILCVANVFTERKGLCDILELSSLIKENETILIIGRIVKKDFSLPNNVVWIKQTNDVHELVAAYSAASVFFNPTYEDNYPTVNLESLACGCPVVSYLTGGSLETADRSYCVKKGDVSGAYDKIEEIIKGKDNYAFIKRERISKENMLKQYLALIEKE